MDRIVQDVLDLLEKAGLYSRLRTPLVLEGMSFAFDAALIGVDGYGGLVVIADVEIGHSENVLRRRLQSFVTLLDREERSIPLTVVMVIRGARPESLHKFAAFARVILVTPSVTVESALQPLLRLALPAERRDVVRTEDVLRGELGKLSEDRLVGDLLRASELSADAVTAVLREAFSRASLGGPLHQENAE